MSEQFVDLSGAVSGSTVYADGQLCARDVSVELPEITMMTNDYNAMGPITLPVPGLVEHMELTVTKIGVDLGLARLIRPQKQDLEFRWVQSRITATGNAYEQGYKAFIAGVPQTIPSVSLEVGASVEQAVVFSVWRYQLFAAGKEVYLIDKLNGICRVGGVDYAANLNSLL